MEIIQENNAELLGLGVGCDCACAQVGCPNVQVSCINVGCS